VIQDILLVDEEREQSGNMSSYSISP